MAEGQYAIVELMGHRIVAGLVSKDEMLGKPLLRVDVPATKAFPAFTQMYGEAAIYSVTFVSEDVARLTAEQCAINPVAVYVPDLVTKEKHEARIAELRNEIRALKGLPAPMTESAGGGDDIGTDESTCACENCDCSNPVRTDGVVCRDCVTGSHQG